MPEPLQVLLIEDNEDDALLLVETLRQGGFKPGYARVDSAEALRQALATESWNIILADYSMPHFSGPAALRLLHELGQDIPFIVVSATVSEEQAIEMMRQGAHDFILKQSMGRLVPAVRRELQEARMRRDRRRAEATLRGILENSPSIIFVKDVDGRFVVVNPRFCEAFQRSADDLMGKTDFDIYPGHPEIAEQMRANDRQIIEKSTPITFEEIVRFPDGEHIFISAKFPIRNPDNTLIGVGSISTDITERKHAEEALQQSEERFRSLYKAIKDAILVHGINQDGTLGAFLEVNDIACQRLGYSREEMLQMSPYDIDEPESGVDIRPMSAEILAGRDVIFEQIHVTKDKRRIPVEIHAQPFLFNGQRVVMSLVRDITERKRAEEALAREQAFLGSAIELLPFPIIFNTPSGEVIRANQASFKFFGDLGKSAWWERELIHPNTRQPIPRDLWPMMSAARGEVVPPMESILLLPEGREVDVLVVAAPVYIHHDLVATVVAFMDISPIKEADRAKNRFLAILSHELRTPLTNILGWVEMAQETPEVVTEALRIIRRNAEVQRRMLERLLDVSRLLYGKFELQRENTDFWLLTEGVVDSLQAEAKERQVTIITKVPPFSLPVFGDVKRLREAVGSVLDNAIRFTDKGGRITVRGRHIESMAEVSIQDTGCGISAEILPHVFELFQIAPEVAKSGGGMGLGLPLAKAIVEKHGGQITFASAEGECGSIVNIRIPMEK